MVGDTLTLTESQKINVRNLNIWYGDHHAIIDADLQIRKNNVTALIGPSGCGKSTLLQIVAGTMGASKGYIEVKSGLRIAALLELGSGFSPEFTGRENIYLNAAVHGLSKKDIDKTDSCSSINVCFWFRTSSFI